MSRGWVLEANMRYRESILAFARACFLAPKEPMYPNHGMLVVCDALYLLKHGKLAPRRKDSKWPDYPDLFDPYDLMSREEVGLVNNITAHRHEIMGNVAEAKRCYRLACEADPNNLDLATDRERYMKKIQQDQLRQIMELDKRRAQILRQQSVPRVVQPKGIGVVFTPHKPNRNNFKEGEQPCMTLPSVNF